MVIKEVKRILKENYAFQLSDETRGKMIKDICHFFYNGGKGFTFNYVSPWGVRSIVKLSGNNVIKLCFEDPEDNILLEDCDGHLLRALYNAIIKQTK